MWSRGSKFPWSIIFKKSWHSLVRKRVYWIKSCLHFQLTLGGKAQWHCVAPGLWRKTLDICSRYHRNLSIGGVYLTFSCSCYMMKCTPLCWCIEHQYFNVHCWWLHEWVTPGSRIQLGINVPLMLHDYAETMDLDLDHLGNYFTTVSRQHKWISITNHAFLRYHFPVFVLGHFFMCGLYFRPRVHLE